MSDDSENFKQSQAAHAQNARIVREVSRHANVPPNQVRQAMRSIVQRNVQLAHQIPQPAPLSQTSPGLFSKPLIEGERKTTPKPFGVPATEPKPPQSTGPQAQRGTFNTPYDTGGDPTEPTAPRANSWDIDSQPTGFDGVIVSDEFESVWGATDSRVVSLDGGGSVTITTTVVDFYRRNLSYDSNGILVHVGPHKLEGLPSATLVEFT